MRKLFIIVCVYLRAILPFGRIGLLPSYSFNRTIAVSLEITETSSARNGIPAMSVAMFETALSLTRVPKAADITAIHLSLEGNVPGADQATFESLANKAKGGCPVSKVLNADISLGVKLTG